MKRNSYLAIATQLTLGALFSCSAAVVTADDNELPFTVGKLFFQLNDTDGDLGIHAKIDGEPWKQLMIEDHRERTVLRVGLRGRMRRQGLTEFKFESAEPSFDELSAQAFFTRFPQGEYEIEAMTLDGEELESEVTLTHVMPAPPEDFLVSGQATPDDCDEGPVPTVDGPIVISWSPVTESHPEIGNDGPVEIVTYEVDVERDDPKLVLAYSLPADATQVVVPQGLFESGDEVKFQVLAGDAGGNETSAESCFIVE